MEERGKKEGRKREERGKKEGRKREKEGSDCSVQTGRYILIAYRLAPMVCGLAHTCSGTGTHAI
jgi:hypothetical protein